MIAVATAFSVIFVKEVFGGTGYNIFNVALVTRAVLFFGYPSKDERRQRIRARQPDMRTRQRNSGRRILWSHPLGQIATNVGDTLKITNVVGQDISSWDMFLGLIPGSVGETSTLCILIGAAILLLTGIASWRIILSVFVGGFVMAAIANAFATPTYPVSLLSPVDQLMLGGFAFAAVFMATDPVTAARTDTVSTSTVSSSEQLRYSSRTYNNGYPEGAMLAVLLMNSLAPAIDYFVVQSNIRRRLRRLNANAE